MTNTSLVAFFGNSTNVDLHKSFQCALGGPIYGLKANCSILH